MKFILITYNMTGCPIAYKMQQEGHDVLVGQIFNKEDILLDEELKHFKLEKSDAKERRLALYDGLLKKVNVQKLIKFLQTQKSSNDWYIFTDSNDTWKFMEQIQNMGFPGHYPTKYDRTLEVSRERAKEFVKANYTTIKVADYQSFKKVKDGIKFLKKTNVLYVLKSQGDAGDTIIPKSSEIKVVKEQLINQLKTQQKDYEQNGFILEEKIEEPKELTPEIVFYNGTPIHTTLDIETKALGSENIGFSMGCTQNLVVKTNFDDPINKLAFPPIVFEMAKQRRGYFIWDISLLFDKNNVPYFGEFCSNRLGWDAFPTEIAMAGESSGNKIATIYFQKITKGENPVMFPYGSAIRIFNISEKRLPSGLKISWDPRAEPDIYLYDAIKEKKDIVTIGQSWDLAVITGIGKSLEESVSRCYEYVDMFHVTDMYYRPKSDFLSKEYRTSILNRYNYAKEQKLI